MEAQAYLQKTLREKLDELKLKNSSFSLRAFARILEISPASLSEFLNGKRALSEKTIKKVAQKIALSPAEYTALTHKIHADKNKLDHFSSLENLKDKVQIQNDQYYLVADWHYYAILCLVETSDFVRDYEWIAKKIKTNATKVKECFERLIRLKVLQYNEKGDLIYKNVELQTSDDIPNTSLRKRHSENLDAAKDYINTGDIDKRDFTFMTLAVDPSQLPEIKKRIRMFQDELASFIETGDKKEVYEFCFNIFPRT